MKKIKRFVKTCPLVVSLLVSWAIVAAAEHLPLDAKETFPEEIQSADGQHIEENEEKDEINEIEDSAPTDVTEAVNPSDTEIAEEAVE